MNRRLSKDELINRIAYHVQEILKLLGEDINRDDLAKTPQRVAKMLLELTKCLRNEDIPEIKFFESKSSGNELIIVQDIDFVSLCEHHLLPIIGKISICYKPLSNKVPGLSKIARFVKWYAKRPILQERFTIELCEELYKLLNAKFVYCKACAIHMCTFIRGVKDKSMFLITDALIGSSDISINELRKIVKCSIPKIIR